MGDQVIIALFDCLSDITDCDRIFRLGRIAKLRPNLRFLVGWAEYSWACSALVEVIAGFSSYYQRKMVL